MSSQVQSARLEMDTSTLRRLLENNQMCVAELRCLDKGSKSLLRELCLSVCRCESGRGRVS